jgi:hypothetical protein
MSWPMPETQDGTVDVVSIQTWLGESIMINVDVNGPRDNADISVSPAGEVLSVN